MTDEQQLKEAGDVVAAAVTRLTGRGLIEQDDQDRAVLNVDGLTTLHDLVVLLTIHTTGPDLPDHVRLVHDSAAILGQAMNIWMFDNDADSRATADAKRQAIAALKRAAREHTY